MSEQTWDTEGYVRDGRFVADLATEVLTMLAPRSGEHILDLGCGDGALTAKLSATGAIVRGVDSSPSMVAAACARGVDARVLSAEALEFESEFDAVFSNAALHWIRDQDALLKGVFRSLRHGGRFVAEMGGHGNIAAIRVALRASLAGRGMDSEQVEQNYFPTAAAYGDRLRAHGFTVTRIELVSRPTPLGPGGMRAWLALFRAGLLKQIDDPERVIEEVEALLAPVLRLDDGSWIADYVRLRFHAVRG